MDALSITKVPFRQAAIETAAVVVLSGAYVAAELAGAPKCWLIAALAAAVCAYAGLTRRLGRETASDFGLRLDNLPAALLPYGMFTVLAAAALVLWAVIRGTALWRDDLAVLLPLYPLYGIAQQFVFQGILHRRLLRLMESRGGSAAGTRHVAVSRPPDDSDRRSLSAWWETCGRAFRRGRETRAERVSAAAVTAAAFGLIHAGDWRLVALTFLAGLAWAVIFQRRPNVWAAGLSHGVLAALAYPLVLGEEPLGRI